MAKKKNEKTSDKKLLCYRCAVVAMGVLVIILLGVIACDFRKRKESDRYMDYYPYLLNQRVQEVCASQREYQNKVLDCRFIEYGLSENNDPYVTYIMVEYDKENYEIIEGTEKTYRLTLWQDESQKTVPVNWGVSEANGAVDE